MFDLRYHVASLAAVFVALVIGIFVGVGLSGRGFVNDAERANLQARIDELRAERDTAVGRASSADVRGEALDSFAETAYPELVEGRLDGKSVGVVFVGSVDQAIAGTVRRAVADAGGRVALMRALRVPLDTESIDETLGTDEELQGLSGPERREQLGREVARELVAGGPTPILRRLSATLVEEQSGISPVTARRGRRGALGPTAAGRDAGLPGRSLRRARVDAHPIGRRGRARDEAEPAPHLPASRPVDRRGGRRGDGTRRARLPARRRAAGELRDGQGRRRRCPARRAARADAGRRVSAPLTVLVAARDEEDVIAASVAALREAFPDAEVVVADDGSHDATADRAEAAGARVVRLPRRGKGQALTLAEPTCGAGPLLLCDADLRGDLRPLADVGGDLAIAAFSRRVGGGIGLAKGVARALIERRGGRRMHEPLSGQRLLSSGRAGRRCSPWRPASAWRRE